MNIHSWVRVDVQLPDHYKTINLVETLGVSENEAIGIVVRLLIFTMKNAWRDGNLRPWGIAGIEKACGWKGERGDLVRALQGCGKENEEEGRGPGFLDGFIVHDWREVSHKLINDRLYQEGRRKGDQSAQPEASVDADLYIESWNEFAEKYGLPPAKPNAKIPSNATSYDDFIAALIKAGGQPYLRGEGPNGWKMDIGWMLNPRNAEKVIEGKYAPKRTVEDEIQEELDRNDRFAREQLAKIKKDQEREQAAKRK